MNRFIAAGFVFLTCGVLAPAVRAGEGNRKTSVTFTAPVEIPGVHLGGRAVLPAGTHVFKILDSRCDRHVVASEWRLRVCKNLPGRDRTRALASDEAVDRPNIATSSVVRLS